MRLSRGGVLLLSVGVLVGCGTADLEFWSICRGPADRDHIDPVTGKPDPCHRDRDAGTDAGEVDGGEVNVPDTDCPEDRECVPYSPHGWSPTPYLMWIGPNGQAPAECPERASENVFHGYGGRLALNAACESCTCETSTGSCEIPTGFTAYSAPGCSPDAVATSFDAPESWDGTCNAEAAIDEDAMCGVPPALCVQSVSIGPLLIKEEACAVGTVPPPPPPIEFEREALACALVSQDGCEGGSNYCLPAPDPFPGGFRYCVYLEQDNASPPCPAGYPDGPWVFYDEKLFVDSRECLCSCGSPVGSECTAFVSIYEDETCSAPVFTNLLTSTMTSVPCTDVAPGVALAGKEITIAPYEGGTCEPKAELLGEFDPGRPETFCCAREVVIH